MSSSISNIKRLATFIKENPNDSFSKFALALEFLKNDDLGKARILFEDIRENDPGYDGVYYHLGKLYEREGRPEDAMETYKKGAEIAADNKKTRNVSELEEALAELKIEMGIDD